jgi:PAS domain S-box-containing protein
MEEIFRVLYVDDEPGLLGFAKLYLEREGSFRVDTLTSAKEALQTVNKERYDAIVSDYQMPDIDGIRFLKQLKESGNTTPFIIFTGRGREEVVVEALNEGADFYLQKGGDPKSQFAELMHKIRSAANRKKTENALRESEIFLKGTQQIARLGGWKANFHTDYLEWTDGIYDIIEAPRNYRPGLMEGMKYYAPEDIPIIQEKVATCLSTGQPFAIEARIITHTGKQVWTEVRGLAPVIEGDRSYVMGTLRDISERKRAEEALQRSEEKHRILNRIISTVNKADDLSQLLTSILDESLHLLDFDAGGIYLANNSTRTAEVIHSKNIPREILAEIQTVPMDENPYDILFIQNKPIFTDNYVMIAPGHSEISGFQSMASIPLLSKDVVIGALNIASTSRYVISDEEKQLLISIGRELGSALGRMLAEEELKKASKNLETLFNSIDEMVYVLDMQGDILSVNDTVQKRLLYTPEELAGTNVLLLHVPERREEALVIVQGMIAGTIESCPVPVLAKDGTRIEVETKVTRGWWNNREVLIGVTRDIAERKQAEEALKRSDEKHRILIENSHDIIYTLTREGILTFVSPSWTTHLGHPVTEVVGKSFRDFVHPDDIAACWAFIQNMSSTGQRQPGIEYRVKHVDGS